MGEDVEVARSCFPYLVYRPTYIMVEMNEDLLDDIKDRFDLFDKIGDGKIDCDQVIDVMRACGLNPMTSDIKKMIKKSDLAGTRVELEAFAAMYIQIANDPAKVVY